MKHPACFLQRTFVRSGRPTDRGLLEHLKIPGRDKADGRLYVKRSGRVGLKAKTCGDVALVRQPEDAQRLESGQA